MMTPAEERDLRRVIADWRRYGIKKGAVAPLRVSEEIDGQKFGIAGLDAMVASGDETYLVPLAKIEVAPPASGCDTLDDCTADQCWGPFYWCKVLTKSADGCLAWECGDCAYLQVLDGIPIPLDVPLPGHRIGDPPSDITGVSLPVDFPCDEEDLSGAALYGCWAGPRSYIAERGDAAGWCADPNSDAYFQVYECELFANWQDCDTLDALGPGYMADVNGCSSPAGVRQVVHFHRLLRGDEFSEPGDPRACAPLFIYKRPKNSSYTLSRDGGDIVLTGPSADVCGDTPTEISRIADCCTDGGGGVGGSGCCPSTTWGAYVVASVPGAGFIVLYAVLDTDYYTGSFVHPGCGLTIYLRFDRETCTLQWSCNPAGPWVSLVQPVTFDVDCSAETGNIAGPYDDLDASGDAASGDCETNSCTVINNIFISTGM